MIDFGSSCYENQRVYTYIQSRFYRAPEGMCVCYVSLIVTNAKISLFFRPRLFSNLGRKVRNADRYVESRYVFRCNLILNELLTTTVIFHRVLLGCILAELYTGFAILPGEDESDQLACIIELLGMPPKPVLENSKRAKIFFNAKGYPRYCTTKTLEDGSVIMTEGFSRRGVVRGAPGTRKLKNALNACEDVYFLQFISECLEWVPEKRLTPEQALHHSWFKRRLPKLPGNGTNSSSSNSYNASKQAHSLTTSTNTLSSGGGGVGDNGKDLASTLNMASGAGMTTNKGITANCFYYDNTLHQLNINNNANQHTDDSVHKSLPANATTQYHSLMHHHNSGGSGSVGKLGDKFQCESYQDLASNRKSSTMTLNRLSMSSSIHSASMLSLVSTSHNSTNNNNNNNNGSSNASISKLPQLNN